MFLASFLDDQEKKELLRELRKAFGMEDKVVFSMIIVINIMLMVFSMMMVIMLMMRLPMKKLPMVKREEFSFFVQVQFPSFWFHHHVCHM